MHKTIISIACLIVSVAALLIAVGTFRLLGAYQESVAKQSKLTEKSAHVIDGVMSTLLMKVMKKGEDLDPAAYDRIMADIRSNADNGYIFERLLLAMKYHPKQKKSDTSEFLTGVIDGYTGAAKAAAAEADKDKDKDPESQKDTETDKDQRADPVKNPPEADPAGDGQGK